MYQGLTLLDGTQLFLEIHIKRCGGHLLLYDEISSDPCEITKETHQGRLIVL